MEQKNYQGALQKPIGSGLNASSTANDVQAAHVRRRVHLVDQRPDRSACGDGPGPGGGIKQEIPAGACGVVCVGHENSPLGGARRAHDLSGPESPPALWGAL